MNFRSIINNTAIRIAAITIIAGGLIYLTLRMTIFEKDPILLLLNSVYNHYLALPEWIANQVFIFQDTGVQIRDHQFVFEQEGIFHTRYNRFIENWQSFLMYKRWSALILVLIWVNYSSIKRRILQSALFMLIHLIAVVLGLLMIGLIGPKMIQNFQLNYFSPTLAGNFVMLLLFSVLLHSNKHVIKFSVEKLGLNINLSNRRMNEVIVLLVFLMLLRDYLIPFIEYRPYVLFLLEVSRSISSVFGYEGYIVGDQLIGADGALALSKHCLGFMTTYLFAAMVYVTRPPGNLLFTLKYLLFGVTLIFLSNIARLVLVFIVAQGQNGYHRASVHHDVYNVGIYILIFGMWVVWFEMQRKRSATRHINYD